MTSKKQLDVSLKNHIINLYERDYKVPDIADIHQVSNKTIYNIINNYNQTGSIQRREGSGRKLDQNTLTRIKDIVNNDHNLSLSDISLFLLEKHGIKCSKTTVYEYLVKNNFVNKNPISKPLLTQDHLNQRQNWAIFYQYYSWRDVIWSDETMISIQSNKLSKIWINKNDTLIKRVVKHPIKIRVWGCILKNYKLILHIYNGTINSDKYIEILELNLLPLIKKIQKTRSNIIFQQDNAPCHTSFKMCEFFSNNKIEVMLWPANSPDLNPIENLWALLKKNVGKIYVSNGQELKDTILLQAKKIKIKTINKIIDSMDNRIEKLFENSFDVIDY